MIRCLFPLYLLGFSTLTLLGCATVKPEGDYQQAGQMISQRTGSQDVYDPAIEELISQKIDELLKNELTVDEAVRVCLLNNRQFQSMFLEIGVSRADVVQSGLLTNPSLTLGMRFPEGGGRNELTLGLAQNIVELWQIPIRRRMAESELEATILRIVHRAIELMTEVKSRCYELLALERNLESARQSRQLANEFYELVGKQQKAGEVSPFDVGLAHTNLIDVDLEVLRIEQQIQTTQTELNRLLGMSLDDRHWKLSDQLPNPSDVPLDSTPLIIQALSARLDARANEKQVTAAEDELIRQYFMIFPDATVGASFERTEQRGLPKRNILADTARASIAAGQLTAPSIQSRGQRDIARRQIIDTMLGTSLTITLPIWDQNQAQIAKARIRVTQRNKEYLDLCDQIASEVIKTTTAVENTRRRVRFFEQEVLPQAQKNVEGATEIFRSGQQSAFILIDLQEDLFQRRREYIDALRDYAISLAELENTLGGKQPDHQQIQTEPEQEKQGEPK
ncbi:MAG: hypothetical protein HJJLKODD_00319 [Phycisphaerae bacterium]|nr:hypothetical protein [Phycisphaerae bacterium]